MRCGALWVLWRYVGLSGLGGPQRVSVGLCSAHGHETIVSRKVIESVNMIVVEIRYNLKLGLAAPG